jgi:hypothetical protein
MACSGAAFNCQHSDSRQRVVLHLLRTTVSCKMFYVTKHKKCIRFGLILWNRYSYLRLRWNGYVSVDGRQEMQTQFWSRNLLKVATLKEQKWWSHESRNLLTNSATLAILTKGICCFLQYFKANATKSSTIRPRPLSSISFPIQYSLFVLSFDAI